MKPYQSFFKGKKITVMGLGLLGRGVGDIRFLAECGAELIVTDLKTREQLQASLDLLSDFPDITYHLGGHVLEDFTDRNLILKAAGVPLNSPYISEAKKNNIPVRMSSDLLVEFAEVKSVGVTGTRGKSTVTHLIAHTLRRAGKSVLLGGNIRGVSSLSLLPKVQKDSILVLELDSWQLQGFEEAKISPNVAVFTNLMQDHQNYYPDEKTYFADKANIFKFQKSGDVLVAGRTVTEHWIREAKPPVSPIVPQEGNWKLKIIGEHNKENASLAAEALRALGLTEEQITVGFESFEPVEGRLQLIREINGIKIFNDNNATTPDATIAALAALSEEKPILIMGGASKKLPLEFLVKVIPELVQGVVLLKGTGTEEILPPLSLLLREKGIPSIQVDSMQEAVKVAFDLAKNKKTILFSPGFASFGMFKNEYDRNDQFVSEVMKLA